MLPVVTRRYRVTVLTQFTYESRFVASSVPALLAQGPALILAASHLHDIALNQDVILGRRGYPFYLAPLRYFVLMEFA